MASKPFSQELFNKYDSVAKRTIAGFLHSTGHTVSEGGRFDIDLEVTKDDVKTMVEVEVKTGWTTGFDFPFNTVHFLYRKEKFFNYKGRVFMVMLNNPLTHAIFIEGKTLLNNAKVIRKNNTYMPNEEFYEVHKSKCPIVELKTGEVRCN